MASYDTSSSWSMFCVLQHAEVTNLKLSVSNQAAWHVQDLHLLALERLLPLNVLGTLRCSLLKGVLGRGNPHPEQLQALVCRQTSAMRACLIAESASQSCVCTFIANEGCLVCEGGIENRLSGAELLKSRQKKKCLKWQHVFRTLQEYWLFYHCLFYPEASSRLAVEDAN